MLFLTFIEIPSANKDLIVSIISMLVGGTGVAMGNLFGTKDEELEKMKDILAQMRTENEVMKTQYETLK
jgi:ABC-type enterochelin transport system permease subunit